VSDSSSDDPAPDEAVPDEAVVDEVVGGDDVVDGEPLPDQASAASVTAEPVSVPVAPAQPLDTGYTAGGVPTFDSVREKIETRYGTAIGAAELASETPEGRTVEEQYDARQRAAAERLEQIRASMHDDESGQA
jgi:hypothetical protein